MSSSLVAVFNITVENTTVTLQNIDATSINWGDGTTNNELTHTYAGVGEYECVMENVTSIGSSAFEGCTNLTSVTIPDGVTSIEFNTFLSCFRLTSVTIPDSVTSIGNKAFSGCSLTSVTIPDGVTSIGYEAFHDCDLTSVTIPDGVTSIGIRTFANCGLLKSVTIPDSVTSIGNQAFYNCRLLQSVTIPDGVTSIGSQAFYTDSFVGSSCLALVECLNGVSPPSISSYTFPSDITIAVPANVLEEYKESWLAVAPNLTIVAIKYITLTSLREYHKQLKANCLSEHCTPASTVEGSNICLLPDDVSTVKHELDVQISSTDETEELSSISVTRYGKNILNLADREVVNFGERANTTLRTFTGGKGIILGLSMNNYYANLDPSVCSITENGITFTPHSTYYGIGLDMKLMPNTTYYYDGDSDVNPILMQFDADGNLITSGSVGSSITTESNVDWGVWLWLRASSTDTIYVTNPQISIYEGVGYDIYTPVCTGYADETGKVQGLMHEGDFSVLIADSSNAVINCGYLNKQYTPIENMCIQNAIEQINTLPSLSTSDEGKILQVVNGSPTWVAITNGNEVAY